VTVVLDISLGLLALGFGLALIRIGRGPTIADRAVAADVAYVQIIAALALLAVRTDAGAFADVVLVGSIIGFLATVSLAWLLEQGGTA
jgi:multicomponent Na+:H+ antiporter subunit F